MTKTQITNGIKNLRLADAIALARPEYAATYTRTAAAESAVRCRGAVVAVAAMLAIAGAGKPLDKVAFSRGCA
jgi:hypothetical protein